MIRQQVGDVLEINFEKGWYYIIVLTKIVMFGGNIVFAYHNDGKKMDFEQLKGMSGGFNICADLLWIKKEKLVTRIGKINNVNDFFRTQYVKGCHESKPGEKAKRWFIYDIQKFGPPIAIVDRLSDLYKEAMDMGTFSFELVIEKIIKRYTPDQNEHI